VLPPYEAVKSIGRLEQVQMHGLVGRRELELRGEFVPQSGQFVDQRLFAVQRGIAVNDQLVVRQGVF
jgi:hypothetical protein